MKPRFVFTRPCSLQDASEAQLDQLLRLTNSPERGDVHDDGGFAGSSFEASIYMERDRRKHPEKYTNLGTSFFIAAHVVGVGQRWLGWCLIEDVQGYYRSPLGMQTHLLQRRLGLACEAVVSDPANGFLGLPKQCMIAMFGGHVSLCHGHQHEALLSSWDLLCHAAVG